MQTIDELRPYRLFNLSLLQIMTILFMTGIGLAYFLG